VTNEIQFAQIAQHLGVLIFDALDTNTTRFTIYQFDQYQFSDYLFINTRFRIDNSARDSFSKSKYILEFAQMMFDKMNLYQNLNDFLKEVDLSSTFNNNLFDNFQYQKRIRRGTLKNM
jgi:hypothetical protein